MNYIAKYLLEKVRNVQTCQRSLQQAEEQFRQGLEGWMDVERLHLKSLTGKIFNEYENVLKPEEQTTTTLGALSSMLSTKGECDRHSGDYIGITLIAALEQQLSLADGLRDLFKTHDDLLSNLDAVNSKISKLESTINSGGGWMGSSTTNISVAKEQLTESKKQLQERTYALHTFYKGLVYFTIPLMARIRAGILRRLCAVYSSCMLSECYSGYKACIDFFKQSMLSAERVSDIAYKLCDTLSITPVPKLPPHVYRGGFMNGSEDVEEDEDTTIYDSSGFLSQDTNGMAGLYDRSMMISKGKSYSSSSTNATSTSNSAAEGDNQSPTNSSSSAGTHLFTSNINTRAEMLESSRSNSTTAPFSPSGEQANPLKSKRGSSVAKSNRTKYTNTIDTELFNDDNAPIEPSPLSSSSADKMEVGSTTEEVENVVSSNPAQRRQSVGANLTYGDTYGEEEEEQMGGSSSVFSDKPSSVLSSLMDGVGGGNPMKSNSSSKIKSDYTFGGHSPMRKSAFDD